MKRLRYIHFVLYPTTSISLKSIMLQFQYPITQIVLIAFLISAFQLALLMIFRSSRFRNLFIFPVLIADLFPRIYYSAQNLEDVSAGYWSSLTLMVFSSVGSTVCHIYVCLALLFGRNKFVALAIATFAYVLTNGTQYLRLTT